jgi:molybdopterin molybdotransferase
MTVGAPKELFNVLPPADAFEVLRPYLRGPVRTERVATEEALGRVLAEDLVSPSNLPTFARSTMDGYAIRAADSFGASESMPGYFNIIGEVFMGRSADRGPKLGEAVRIATGGMLPNGADAVVMIEHTQDVDGETIEVLRPVAPGENVVQIGEDVRLGTVLLEAGQILRPEDIGGLLALGVTSVNVSARLRVGIISGGDEVVPPSQEPGPAQIRDINSYTISALVERAGHTPVRLGIVPDVYEALHAATLRAHMDCDVVVLSAGSSVSTRDMTADVIAALGEPGLLVHGVSLRPGKPTILGYAGGKPVFGLPGNPVSCIVTFDLFVAPTLYLLAGCPDRPPRRTVAATLSRNVASAPGREDYFQVTLHQRDGTMVAEPVFGKSNLIYTLVKSDGMVKIDLDRGGLTEGETVDVILY